MSDVLKALSDLEPYLPGAGQCGTCKMIAKEPEIGEAILKSYRSGVSAAMISRVLQSHGYHVNERPLQSHLKNGHQPI